MKVICSLLVILTSCYVQQITADCLLSEWSTWSVCSERCGGNGVSKRSRTIQHGSNDECPRLGETKTCNRFCNNEGIVLSNRCICLIKGVCRDTEMRFLLS